MACRPSTPGKRYFQKQYIVRKLPPDELAEAEKVINGTMDERFNVTIRWHERHYNGCPYVCDTAEQIPVHKAPAPRIHIDSDDPGMANVRKIVGPVARPPAPPPVAKSDAASQMPSSSSSPACPEPKEKAVETQRVDTQQE